jgi:hypothetical protein
MRTGIVTENLYGLPSLQILEVRLMSEVEVEVENKIWDKTWDQIIRLVEHQIKAEYHENK